MKTLEAPQEPTTPSRPPHDPAEEFLEALRTAANLLNEIDPRNFTREERKWMADTVKNPHTLFKGKWCFGTHAMPCPVGL